jgi:hypothetical protein
MALDKKRIKRNTEQYEWLFENFLSRLWRIYQVCYPKPWPENPLSALPRTHHAANTG